MFAERFESKSIGLNESNLAEVIESISRLSSGSICSRRFCGPLVLFFCELRLFSELPNNFWKKVLMDREWSQGGRKIENNRYNRQELMYAVKKDGARHGRSREFLSTQLESRARAHDNTKDTVRASLHRNPASSMTRRPLTETHVFIEFFLSSQPANRAVFGSLNAKTCES